MSKAVCPSCGADLKEVGFYINQSVNYAWDDEDKRFVISCISQNEVLSPCCDAEIEDVIHNVQTLEKFYSE